MGRTFVLVEYHYDGVKGDEYPQVFVGTSDECKKMMVELYDKFRKLYDKDEEWSCSAPEDGYAICQGEDGAENRRVVNGMRQTYAERVGLNNGRGKYNDENKLFDQDSASLKVGEVAAWSTI